MSDLGDVLEQRLSALDRATLTASIARLTDGPAPEVASRLDMYLNESRAALRLLEPHLSDGARVLEIGSGIGFFARFLDEHGVDVVELEPVGEGFEFMGAARAALAEHSIGSEPTHLAIGVDDLDPKAHGPFDLIYSLNVFEHVPDWRHGLTSATRVLAPGGVMVVSCANYTVPYEPHFGIPLVPVRPHLTARLLPARITDTGLWKSLNWITARGVRRWAHEHDAELELAGGQLATALERVVTDAEFRARRGVLIRGAATALNRLGLLSLLRRLPPSWSTPMEFTLRHRSDVNRS